MTPTTEYVAQHICGYVYSTREGVVGILAAECDLQNLTVLREDGARYEMRAKDVFNGPQLSDRAIQATRRWYLDTRGDMPVERYEWRCDPVELAQVLRELSLERVA